MIPTYDQAEVQHMSRDLRVFTGSIAFDSSYPTGGEAMDLSSKFAALKLVLFENDAGYVFQYDYTNKKVLAYYYDYDAGADGTAIQVANATDLSALTDVRFIAFGQV